MNIRIVTIPVLLALLAAEPTRAQTPASAAQEDVLRQSAENLRPHSVVVVQLMNGSRVKGHLVSVSPDSVRVLKRFAMAERVLPWSTIESIRMADRRDGMGLGAKIGLWSAVGGAIAAVIAAYALTHCCQ